MVYIEVHQYLLAKQNGLLKKDSKEIINDRNHLASSDAQYQLHLDSSCTKYQLHRISGYTSLVPVFVHLI